MVHLGKCNNEVGNTPSSTTPNTTTSAGINGVSTHNIPAGDYQVTKADFGERRSIHFEPFKSATTRHIAPLDHAALTVQDYRAFQLRGQQDGGWNADEGDVLACFAQPLGI
jgi:hypothetical protein